MAGIKRKVRRKLTKQLKKVVKRHGPDATLALVSGIVGSLNSDAAKAPKRKRVKPAPAAGAHQRVATRASH